MTLKSKKKKETVLTAAGIRSLLFRARILLYSKENSQAFDMMNRKYMAL